MKNRIAALILVVLFLITLLTACKGTEQIEPVEEEKEQLTVEEETVIEMPPTIISLLEEYERACEDENYTRDKWQEINNNFVCYWYQNIGYSLKDINGDGTEELIIGYYCDSEYLPVIIHATDNLMSSWGITDYYKMTIYKNGILEVVSDRHYSDIFIYKLSRNLELTEEEQLFIDTEDEWKVRYYRELEDGKAEITRDDFNEIREKSTRIPEKLEWKKLDGFWNSDVETNPVSKEQKIIISLLEEYERAQEEELHTKGKWKKIDDSFEKYWNQEMGYSIKDFNGDGIDELIIGKLQDSEYRPVIIHFYDEDMMPSFSINDSYRATIYNDGVIEIEGGSYFSSDFIYRLDEKWGVKKVDELYVLTRNGKCVNYYEGPENLLHILSKKEFDNRRNRYISEEPEELEWRKLEGFWNPEIQNNNR